MAEVSLSTWAFLKRRSLKAQQNLSTEWDSNIADPDAIIIEPVSDDTFEVRLSVWSIESTLTVSKQDLTAGWVTDVMVSKSDDPVSTWAFTNQDSATDYLTAFDD